MSPYACYVDRQKFLASVVVLALVAGFLAMIGLAAGYSSGERNLIFHLAVWGSRIIGVTSVVGLLIYLFSHKGIKNGKDDLKGFESKLDDVLRFLGKKRPVHLMTGDEISEEAREVLNTLAFSVLNCERVFSSWSPETENARTELRKTFKLFKFYGLIEGNEVYDPFFAEAKKRMTTPLENPPAFKDPNWATFDEALQYLGLREDELKRLTSEAELCAFRDGDDGLKFRREDIEKLEENLKRRQEEKIAPFSPAEGK